MCFLYAMVVILLNEGFQIVIGRFPGVSCYNIFAPAHQIWGISSLVARLHDLLQRILLRVVNFMVLQYRAFLFDYKFIEWIYEYFSGT